MSVCTGTTRCRASPVGEVRDMDASLREYQREDAEWLSGRDYGYLAADPGTGKSLTVLASLRPEHLPVVVVAPAYVARYTWPDEVRKWRPDLSVRVLRSGDTLTDDDGHRADVYCVSYSIVHKIKWPRKYTVPVTLVLDEAQYIKSWRATRSKACKELSRLVSRRILLSGTPFGNSLADIHHQALVMDGGASLGKQLGQFRNVYMFPEQRDPRTGMVWRWGEKPGARDKVVRRLSDSMRVRRLEDHLDLPDRLFVTHDTILTSAERRVYHQVREAFVAEFENGQVVAALSSAAVTSKLRQVCSGAVLDDKGEAVRVGRSRMDAVRSVVEDVCGGPDLDGGRPLLVWTQFRAEQRALLEMLGDKAVLSDGWRDWVEGKVPVLVTHPASLGAGVNLQEGGCHDELYVSQPWSLEHWVQSQARLRRSGQTHRVVTHLFRSFTREAGGVLEPTVDTRVTERLGEKMDLLEAVREALRV